MLNLSFFSTQEIANNKLKYAEYTLVKKGDAYSLSYQHPCVKVTDYASSGKLVLNCKLYFTKVEATEFEKRFKEVLSNPEYWTMDKEEEVTYMYGKLISLAFYVPMKQVLKPYIDYEEIISGFVGFKRKLDEPLFTKTRPNIFKKIMINNQLIKMAKQNLELVQELFDALDETEED